MTYDNWKSTDLSDWDYQDQDGEQECQHEWAYEMTLDGGGGDAGEGRCYCEICGETY